MQLNNQSPTVNPTRRDQLKCSPLGELGKPRRELWNKLCSIARFRSLEQEEQVILFGVLATQREANADKVSSVANYAREVLRCYGKISDLLGDRTIDVLFHPETVYADAGVFDDTDSVLNKRKAAIKYFLNGAVRAHLIDFNHLSHLKGKKIRTVVKPATNDDIAQALDVAVAAVLSAATRKGRFPIEVRDLLLCDIKGYGLRSCEMEWMTRGDIAGPVGLIRKSKTELGKRRFRLAPDTRALLARYIAEVDEYRAAKGLEPLGDDDPLFWTIQRTPLKSRWASDRVSKMLPDGVRPHALRAHVGTAIANGGNEGDVAAVLGIDPRSVGSYVAAAAEETLAGRVHENRVPVDVASLGLSPVEENNAPPHAPQGPTGGSHGRRQRRPRGETNPACAHHPRPLPRGGRRPGW